MKFGTMSVAVALGLGLVRPAAAESFKVGFMGPFANPNGTTYCDTCAASFLAAVRYINKNGLMGDGDSIDPVMWDTSTPTGTGKVRAYNASEHVMADRASCDGNSDHAKRDGINVVAAVADHYSSTVRITGMSAEVHRVPMVGYGATSDDFTDKMKYPWFSRVCPPDRYQAPALARTLSAIGWNDVAILNADESYGAGFAIQFADAFEALPDHTVRARQSFAPDSSLAEFGVQIDAIRESKAKVILVSAAGGDAVTAVRALQDAGLTGPGFTLVAPDGWSGVSELTGANSDIPFVARGGIAIFPSYRAPGGSFDESTIAHDFIRDVSEWEQTYTDADESEPRGPFDARAATGIDPPLPFNFWGFYVWDATIRVARAIGIQMSGSRSAYEKCGDATNIPANAGAAADDSECLQSIIRGMRQADGTTGDVVIDANGDRLGSYSILTIVDPAQHAGKVLLPVGTVTFQGDGTPDVDIDVSGVMWSDGTVGSPAPSDGDFSIEQDPTVAIAVGVTFGVIVLALIPVVMRYRRNAQKARAELDKFSASMGEGVRQVVRRFDPTPLVRSRNSGDDADQQPARERSDSYVEAANPESASVVLQPYTSKWYWEEDRPRLAKHNPHMVLTGTSFVEYSGAVCAELERAYQEFKAGNASAQHNTDLTERISTTGNEQKAFAADSGYKYIIDFQNLKQINARTRYQRNIRREEQQILLPESVSITVPPSARPSESRRVSPGRSAGRSDMSAGDVTLPREIANQDLLSIYKGQLIQVSKQRTDGWTYGTIIFDEDDDREEIAFATKGISSDCGWFPTEATSHADPDQLARLAEAMGGADNLSLAQPDTWEPVQNDMVAQFFPLSVGNEKTSIVNFFMRTLDSSIVEVQNVLRIQNTNAWKTYAVKKQTMLARENADTAARFERMYLFHGCRADVVPKIAQQGFNRSFCGLNATYYGKGVYFARDASYSINPIYSTPDDDGVQRMFLCRVMVGEYCRGVKDALTPDMRDPANHLLYDSTVDSVQSPSLFVTYHDAQAYPEYVIEFRQRHSSTSI